MRMRRLRRGKQHFTESQKVRGQKGPPEIIESSQGSSHRNAYRVLKVFREGHLLIVKSINIQELVSLLVFREFGFDGSCCDGNRDLCNDLLRNKKYANHCISLNFDKFKHTFHFLLHFYQGQATRNLIHLMLPYKTFYLESLTKTKGNHSHVEELNH